jgi:hypothetical protein
VSFLSDAAAEHTIYLNLKMSEYEKGEGEKAGNLGGVIQRSVTRVRNRIIRWDFLQALIAKM